MEQVNVKMMQIVIIMVYVLISRWIEKMLDLVSVIKVGKDTVVKYLIKITSWLMTRYHNILVRCNNQKVEPMICYSLELYVRQLNKQI